jgi:outer membrane protein assembly factor BamB
MGGGQYELNRRDFLRGVTVFALLSTAHYPLTNAYSQSADAWPQFRGNYNNTGVSPSQAPAELKLLWTYDAGDLIESSAAIVAGTVYVGTGKSALIAVDLQSGK